MDPPPTEIYTYLPTLSLHDALPISGIKTRLLLGNLHSPAGYVPVEISAPALQASVAAIAAELPQLPVRPVCADFTRPHRLPDLPVISTRTVIYFPGSTLGHFEDRKSKRLNSSHYFATRMPSSA